MTIKTRLDYDNAFYVVANFIDNDDPTSLWILQNKKYEMQEYEKNHFTELALEFGYDDSQFDQFKDIFKMDENTKSVCKSYRSLKESKVRGPENLEKTGKLETWLKNQAKMWTAKAQNAYANEFFKPAYQYEKLAKEIEEVLK